MQNHEYPFLAYRRLVQMARGIDRIEREPAALAFLVSKGFERDSALSAFKRGAKWSLIVPTTGQKRWSILDPR